MQHICTLDGGRKVPTATSRRHRSLSLRFGSCPWRACRPWFASIAGGRSGEFQLKIDDRGYDNQNLAVIWVTFVQRLFMAPLMKCTRHLR